MGFLDAIKGLLGGAGVGDLIEQTGIGEQLGAVGDLVQQPVDELGGPAAEVGEQVGSLTDVAQQPVEELSAQAESITGAADLLDPRP